jgi:hypothetical protein
MSGLLSLYDHQAGNKSAERNLSSLLVLLSMVWDISEVAALTSICFMNQVLFSFMLDLLCYFRASSWTLPHHDFCGVVQASVSIRR